MFDIFGLIFWLVFSINDVYTIGTGGEVNTIWLIVDTIMLSWFIYSLSKK